MTDPGGVPGIPRFRPNPPESPSSGVTIFGPHGWFRSTAPPRAPAPVGFIEDADPGLARLVGDDYMDALIERVASEYRLPDRYIRPVLPVSVERAFMLDLPRLIRFMDRNHRDGGATPTGHAAMTAILMTLADLAGAV